MIRTNILNYDANTPPKDGPNWPEIRTPSGCEIPNCQKQQIDQNIYGEACFKACSPLCHLPEKIISLLLIFHNPVFIYCVISVIKQISNRIALYMSIST